MSQDETSTGKLQVSEGFIVDAVVIRDTECGSRFTRPTVKLTQTLTQSYHRSQD